MNGNDEIDRLVNAIALKNAAEHSGSTNVNTVLAKILSLRPELKKEIKTLMAEIKTVVDSVNKMDVELQKKYLNEIDLEDSKIDSKSTQKHVASHSLPELQMTGTRVITRFPPEPNGYPHIGHAKAAIIDEEYARRYDGKLILRFDDTNPQNEKLEYYEAIRSGLEWLGVKPDIVKNTSDDIFVLHDYGKKLTLDGNAYVCTCDTNKIHKMRMQQVECPCRGNIDDAEKNKERLDKLFDGTYHQNDAIVRFKGNMQDNNTVLRDPTLFRIIEAPHPLLGDKVQVWPTYDFAAPVEDCLDGVSHALRSKEYELRNALYLDILDRLELRKPIVVEFSRLEFENMPVSKRKIKQLIDDNHIAGWDDPRLLTLSAMRKRGFDPRAIRSFVLSLGLTLAESKPPFKTLESMNRKILEPIAIRLFFVKDPIKIIVEDAQDTKVTLRNHPNIDLGTRQVEVSNVVYISQDDAILLTEDEEIRLMELYNINIKDIDLDKKVITASYLNNEIVRDMKKIQWVSDKNKTNYTVLVPKELYIDDKFNPNSLERIEGYAETSILQLKSNTQLQLTRFGFCNTQEKTTAIFIHR
ncbi:MAG: glutamate--tRNA ligase [Nitrososphaeraceae archaeon]|nr:glutamate--tRNA ligase [Nitrososphaeraceae archaeon]MDW0133947.1 glutamate--tRNA ligase [Nitrososphaeraceae archaeon]